MASKLAPLSTQVPIVDEHGNPTPYFQQLMQILLDEKAATDALAAGAAPVSRLINTGTGLTGGGDLSADRTISLNANLDDLLDVDTTTTPPTNGQALVYNTGSALWKPGNVASGGGGGTTPTVRAGTCTALASVSSTSVSWPTGTVAGDVVVIFGGHGFAVNTPSGWTTLDSATGSNWNGAVFAKVMTAADITAGSVTVTFSGSFNGVVAAITIDGTTVQTFVKAGSTRSSSGVTSATELCTFTTNTDLVLCFASTRANTTCDVTNASAVAIASNSGTSASGDVESLSGESSIFGTTVTNTFGASGSGYYVAAVAFR